MHAIIIDDNTKNISILARLLSEEGFSNTRVVNPYQLGIALETTDRADIIFLDIEMPGLNGYDILEQLKSDQRFEGTPVVAHTVHGSEINRAFEQGFHSFISKPINSDKFPDQLSRILKGERVWERI